MVARIQNAEEITGLPKWPVYCPRTKEILDIQSGGKPVGKPDPGKARLDVIEKAMKMGDKLQPKSPQLIILISLPA
jgi:hypothetical protein